MSTHTVARRGGFDEDTWQHLRDMLEMGEAMPRWMWEQMYRRRRNEERGPPPDEHNTEFCEDAIGFG
jgi:hypothetical protein